MDSLAAARWKPIPCALNDGRSSDGVVGLVALAADTAIEPELRGFLRGSHVEVHTTRIPFQPASMLDRSAELQENILGAVRVLLPGEPLDVVALGCTSAAAAIGSLKLQAAVCAQRPGVQFTDPLRAAIESFHALDVRRLGLLTPYDDRVNDLIQGVLASNGLEITECATFRAAASARLRRTPATRVPPDAVAEAAVELGSKDVDAVFVCCTGLRSLAVVGAVERATGKPMISSDLALAWHCMTLTGCIHESSGRGVLLEARRGLSTQDASTS